MPEDYAAVIPYRSGGGVSLLLPRAMLTLARAVVEGEGMAKSVALLQPRSLLRSMAPAAIRVQLLRVWDTTWDHIGIQGPQCCWAHADLRGLHCPTGL